MFIALTSSACSYAQWPPPADPVRVPTPPPSSNHPHPPEYVWQCTDTTGHRFVTDTKPAGFVCVRVENVDGYGR